MTSVNIWVGGQNKMKTLENVCRKRTIHQYRFTKNRPGSFFSCGENWASTCGISTQTYLSMQLQGCMGKPMIPELQSNLVPRTFTLSFPGPLPSNPGRGVLPIMASDTERLRPKGVRISQVEVYKRVGKSDIRGPLIIVFRIDAPYGCIS